MTSATPERQVDAGAPAPQVGSAGTIRKAAAVSVLEPAFPVGRVLRRTAAEADADRHAAAAELAAARQEAEAIRRAADEEIAALRAEAAAAAREEARQEFAAAITALQAVDDELLRAAGPGLRDLALRIAEVLVDVELQRDPKRLLPLCEQVLQAATGRRRVVLHVAPQLRELVAAECERLAGTLPLCESLQVVADPLLPIGGVRVDTELGSYDGSVQARLEQLRRQLLVEDASEVQP